MPAPFVHAHATHPHWEMAAALVVAQLKGLLKERAQAAHRGDAPMASPGLGLLYLTDHFSEQAADILNYLEAEMPFVTDWVGTTGVGVLATGTAYVDEPAMVAMLCDWLPHQFRVFHGMSPLPQSSPGASFRAQTALVHMDSQQPDATLLLHDLAARVGRGGLWGGMGTSRRRRAQWARSSQAGLAGWGHAHADGVFDAGFSGVALDDSIGVSTHLTQGVVPIGHAHEVTRVHGHTVLGLDDQPALDVLRAAMGWPAGRLGQHSLAMADVSVAISDTSRTEALPGVGVLNESAWVRPLVGVDMARQGVVVGEALHPGMQLTWVTHKDEAMLPDVRRLAAELREALEDPSGPDEPFIGAGSTLSPHDALPRQLLGAVYISCVSRLAALHDDTQAEMRALKSALGDVPLVGFCAGGEVAHNRLHTYSGVLTVFYAPV